MDAGLTVTGGGGAPKCAPACWTSALCAALLGMRLGFGVGLPRGKALERWTVRLQEVLAKGKAGARNRVNAELQTLGRSPAIMVLREKGRLASVQRRYLRERMNASLRFGHLFGR